MTDNPSNNELDWMKDELGDLAEPEEGKIKFISYSLGKSLYKFNCLFNLFWGNNVTYLSIYREVWHNWPFHVTDEATDCSTKIY